MTGVAPSAGNPFALDAHNCQAVDSPVLFVLVPPPPPVPYPGAARAFFLPCLLFWLRAWCVTGCK